MRLKWSRILLVWHTLFSHYRHHPAQGVFLLLGLSLGVAILLGTLMVGESATKAFNKAQSTLGGTVIAHIRPINGQKTIPESTYSQLRLSGFSDLIPKVEGRVQLDDGSFVRLQGIDIFASIHHNSGPQLSQQSNRHPLEQNLSLTAFSYPPYQTLVSHSQAQLLGLTNGQILTLKNSHQLPAIQIVSDQLGLGYGLLCDLRCAQDILAQPSQLTSIILSKKLQDQQQFSDALTTIGPKDVALGYAAKNPENQAMSDAFFLNITAVSFLAFLVGCFIAFNAVRFSVLQRLRLVQQLRLLGVTVNEVICGLLIELVCWALLASIIGWLLGALLATALLPGVGLTLAQMFMAKNLLNLGDLHQWWLLALLIAFVATLLATAQPFYQLAQQQPLQTRTQNQQQDQPFYGLLLLTLGGLLTFFPHSQALGFAIAACWFIGGALCVPGLLSWCYRVLSQIKGLANRPLLHWAISDGQANQKRLSIAMMAFTVAIAAGIGVTTMVASFRLALEDHLDVVLAEDLYLSPDNNQTLAIKRQLDQNPEVELAYRFFHTNSWLQQPGSDQSFSANIRTISNHALRHNSLNIQSQVDDLWPKLHQRQGVLISQTMAFQQQLQLNDQVSFELDENVITTSVLGVYYSYGDPQAALGIDQAWFNQLWPNVSTAEVGVFLVNPNATAKVLKQLTQTFELKQHQVLQPQTIKQMALNIFEQTFQVTQVLTLFTLFIAAIGIYCACYAAELDNQRQHTLLKVLGVNQRQVVGLALLQLMFNALVAAIVALPLGILIAWASVEIVLQYSFGWHFALDIQPLWLGLICLGAVLTAVIAGFVPLYQLSRKTLIDAFREAT